MHHLKSLSAAEKSRLLKTIKSGLGDDDATIETTNRFRLRRPSGQSEFEFRDRDLRVFYRVEGGTVVVDAIGRKRGSQLFIGTKKVTL